MKSEIIRRFFFCAIVLAFVLGGIPSEAQNLFQPRPDPYGGLGLPGDAIPFMDGLRTGTLPNGLRYFIRENSLPAGRAYLTLAVRAGSVLEKEDERGLAHFVEHMAFNGTRRFPETELINYLRSLGMRFGPEVNAYTSFENTVYGIEAPVEIDDNGVKRIPEKALAILDDWTWGITFNSKDVDEERAIILEEYRSGLGAQERVRDRFLKTIFRGSRMAERLPIGLTDVIRTAPAERLETFYRRWYRPDNMALILVGDFDGAALEAELAAHFTAPKPVTPLALPAYELPPPVSGSVNAEVISDAELPYATVYLYFKQRYGEQRTDLCALRDNLTDYLISSMLDVRHTDAASNEETPFLGAGAWASRYGLLSQYYILAAQAKTGQAADTLETLLTEKESLYRYGFTGRELDRAKASMISGLEFQVSEKDRRESTAFVETLTGDFTGAARTSGIEWLLDAAVRMLPAIDTDTVNARLRSYFADDDLMVLLTVPEQELAGVPDAAGIALMVEKSRSADIAVPGEEADTGGLVDEPPAPGSIAAESRDPSGAFVWTLSNGATLILKKTPNRNNELSFYALARGGESSVPLEDDFSAYLASEIQAASGLGPFTRPELFRFLSDKQVSLSFWTNSYTRGFNGEASLNDLETLFELLYVSFTQPRIEQSGLNLVREARRTRLIQEKDNPESIFSRELTRLVYGGHPRFMPMELENLDDISAEKAAAFLKKALNPADYIFVFAGNLGPDQAADGTAFPLMRRLAETWLASIPGGADGGYAEAWNNWDDPGVTRPGKTEQIIRKGKEQKAMVYMAWFSPAEWTEQANAAALLLSDYLDIILNDEIREKLGGVYSVSQQASFTPMPKGELSLGIYFVCDPGRAVELRTAVQEKLAGIAAGDINAETFNRAKEALVKSFELSMENNVFIARNYATFRLVTDIPLSHLERRPELYRSVTADDLRSLMARILENGPAELVLFPEESPAP
jgi:zinc protease